jgi:outer membrane protein assembly factor BamA
MKTAEVLLPGKIFILASVILFLSSCGGLKHLPEGRYLLVKNTVKIDHPGLREQVTGIIKQKPNRKMLGLVRFHMGVYQIGERGKDNKFNNWLMNTVGEPPTLLDTNLSNRSSAQIEMLMENNGFFNAIVTDTTVITGKKAHVIYQVKSGEPYTIRNFYYTIQDSAIASLVYSDTSKCKIHRGDNYSTSVFQKERERISNHLRNIGYYFFNPLYINFKADTSLKSNQLDLFLNIVNPRDQIKDSLATDTTSRHRLAYFNEIFVEMDYDPIKVEQNIEHDTLHLRDYRFISNSDYRYLYKPERILDHVFIYPDSLFGQSKLDLTYRRLADLSVFRFVNIRFEQQEGTDSLGRIPLNAWLLLSPQQRQEYKIEAEGTNSGGNLGIGGRFTYRNKNIFRGAESLIIRLKAGLELQRNFGDTIYESIKEFGVFNAYEIGPEVTLNFPRFLVPFKIPFREYINNPSTSIGAGYNLQNRPEYYRQLFNLSFFYAWRTNQYFRHFIYPAEINFLSVDLDPAFEQQLIELNDINLLLGYTDQLISNGRYSLIYNNQDLNSSKNYSFLRFNFELAGNTIYFVKKLNGENIDKDNPSTVFGIPFAQYVRPDIDYSFYHVLSPNKSRTMVYRIASGIGYSYGNAKLMPFEKSFFAGGPNDNRAWRSRTIGPGSSVKNDPYERFGDIKIATNAEYRFDITRKFKGAAFIDAGNIWLFRDYSDQPGGTFAFESFLNEFAVGGGLGIRFDLTFFIIRVDGAVQMRDPEMPSGERWVFRANQFNDIFFNFGIGYPF